MRGIAIVLGLGGCWAAARPPPPPPPEPALPVIAADPFPLHSEWIGLYRCSQGVTAMRLVLEARPNGELSAVFEFGPTEENPTIPLGSYRLRGTIEPGAQHTFGIHLDPEEWLVEPPGYTMVPLRATSSRRWTHLVGRIEHPNCAELDVRRSD